MAVCLLPLTLCYNHPATRFRYVRVCRKVVWLVSTCIHKYMFVPAVCIHQREIYSAAFSTLGIPVLVIAIFLIIIPPDSSTRPSGSLDSFLSCFLFRSRIPHPPPTPPSLPPSPPPLPLTSSWLSSALCWPLVCPSLCWLTNLHDCVSVNESGGREGKFPSGMRWAYVIISLAVHANTIFHDVAKGQHSVARIAAADPYTLTVWKTNGRATASNKKIKLLKKKKKKDCRPLDRPRRRWLAAPYFELRDVTDKNYLEFKSSEGCTGEPLQCACADRCGCKSWPVIRIWHYRRFQESPPPNFQFIWMKAKESSRKMHYGWCVTFLVHLKRKVHGESMCFWEYYITLSHVTICLIFITINKL